MQENLSGEDRADILADVAEMYYIGELTQAEIAKKIGLTRSMVSRMISEARKKGIVRIEIARPIRFDPDLSADLVKEFDLVDAFVLKRNNANNEHHFGYLGVSGARLLKRYLVNGVILGITWGTTVSRVVNALEVDQLANVKIVQLAGALGARIKEYDGYSLIKILEEKLGGEGFYLNAPYILETVEMVQLLKKNINIQETICLGNQCDVALLGIGSTKKEYSYLYQSGYVSLEELAVLQEEGAVGDVLGLHFDIQGKPACAEFCDHLVTISKDDFLRIHNRIGIAGGVGKVLPVLGAMRSGYINTIVTDDYVAKEVLKLL